MITKLIHVTQEDIDKGCRFNSGNCPVARAVTRELGAGSDPSVRYSDIFLSHAPGRRVWAHTTRSVRRFIGHFDMGYPVKPFNFRLKYDEGQSYGY